MSTDNRRILIVDDNPAIHDDFRKILEIDLAAFNLEEVGSMLFDKQSSLKPPSPFELRFASQGPEALELVTNSITEGRPFALVFMDMRMPPGWDGIETVNRLWKVDRYLQVVFCTAYADCRWSEVVQQLDQPDQFVVLKKPFDCIEVLQMANAFTEHWNLLQLQSRVEENLRQAQAQLERTVAERTQELSAARMQMEHLLDSSPVVLYSLKLESCEKVTFISANATSVLGFEPTELAASGFWTGRIPLEDVPELLAFRKALAVPGTQSVCYRFLHRDGDYRWIRDNAKFMAIHPGGAVEIVGCLSDITQTRRAEEELRRKEEQSRLLLESLGEGVVFVDKDQRFTFANPAAHEIMGVAAGCLVGRDVLDFLDPEEQKHFQQQIEMRQRGQRSTYELRITTPANSRRDVMVTATPCLTEAGTFGGSFAVLHDISERKRAEEVLRVQTAALEAADSGILITDVSGVIKWANSGLSRLSGFSREELVGQKPSLFCSGTHDRDFYREMWQTVLGGKVWRGELLNRRKDGSQYHEEMTITPVRDASGQLRHFVAIKQDISARKQWEAELAYQRDLLQTLMENSPDSIYFKDRKSRFLRCSHNLALRFGRTNPEEVIGLTDFDFFEREHAEAAYFDEQEIIETGTPIIGKVEQEVIKGSDKAMWVLTNKLPFRNRDGEIVGTFGISKDITALKTAELARQALEVQLRQGQKLEAIGQLAAGIAHEINTPTQYVSDNSRFLQESFRSILNVVRAYEQLRDAVKKGGPTAEALNTVEEIAETADVEYLFEQVPAAIGETLEGIDRVARIVRAMKEFSHPGSKEKRPTDLNRAIETTVTVARNEWKYVADMSLDLDSALPAVPCLVGEFNQAMLNLIVNAAHAIADAIAGQSGKKGTITISTRRNGDYAEVHVRDTGTGIPEAIQSKVFEPFFTTKPIGKGSGQGLPIVYASIVKHHGGDIRFETESGVGTLFILSLPLAAKAESVEETKPLVCQAVGREE